MQTCEKDKDKQNLNTLHIVQYTNHGIFWTGKRSDKRMSKLSRL